MPSKLYPRYGCSFCPVTRDKKDQIMVHFDEYLPEVNNHRGRPTRPEGEHFLPLLRAVRRRSARHGTNALIDLDQSRYDICRNWCLHDDIANEAELITFLQRDLRSRAEWKAVATKFLTSHDAEMFSEDVRALWDSYKPKWTAPNTRRQDKVEDDDESQWERYITLAKANGSISGLGNTNVDSQVVAPVKLHVHGGTVDARVQSGCGSPVKAKNAKFTVFNEASGNISGMKQNAKIKWGKDADKAKSNLGKARMDRFVSNLAENENEFNNAVKKEDDGGRKAASKVMKQDNQEDPDDDFIIAGRKSSAGVANKRRKAEPITPHRAAPSKRTANDKGKGKGITMVPQAEVEIIDLTTPPTVHDRATPAFAETFDIDSPDHHKSITLFVKSFHDRGIFEIDLTSTLDAAIHTVEARMDGVHIKCFRQDGKKLTERMWDEKPAGIMVVTADCEFEFE